MCHSLDFIANFTSDDIMEMFADGRSLGKHKKYCVARTFLIPENTRVISVFAENTGGKFGIRSSSSNGLVTNKSWNCVRKRFSGWNLPDFDDKHWPHAVVVSRESGWYPAIAKTAKWIWAGGKKYAYCRLNLK